MKSNSGANKDNRPRARRIALLIVAIPFLGLVVISLLSWIAGRCWVCDNLAAFTVQYTAASGAFLLLFALLRSRAGIIAGVALLAINFLALVMGTEPAPRSSDSRLLVVSANVRRSNQQHERVLHYFRASEADVIVVIEVDEAWVTALKDLEGIYPYAIYEPRGDNFGMALLSRYPFKARGVIGLGDHELPFIRARIEIDGRPVTIIAAHPFPPVGGEGFRMRNRYLLVLGSWLIARTEGEVIVAGDLNVAPWSHSFQRLLAEGDLREARGWFDLAGTWPAFAPGLRTRIDHILVSRGLTVSEARVGPDIGSDHLPIEALVGW